MINIYRTDFVGQEIRSSLTGLVLVFTEIVAKMLAGTAVIWNLSWGWGSALDMAHSCCSQVGAGYRQETWILHHMALSIGVFECSHCRAAGLPQSEWAKTDQGGSSNGFYDLALEVTHHHFHGILFVTQPCEIWDLVPQRCEYQCLGVIWGIILNARHYR